MGETGMVRFPGNLDPRAREFRPRNAYDQTNLTLLQPQIYYPYPCLPYPSSELQFLPFCDEAGAGAGVGYAQFAASSAYVRPAGANPLPPPPLPPPSAAPSRTLLLSSVPTHVSESTVRRELEVFGDVRAVQMERVRDGMVTVHFYDLRHAQAAVMEIREQHMQQQSRLRKHFEALLAHDLVYEAKNLAPPLPPPARGLIDGRAVWAQFMIPSIPSVSGVPCGQNQGTLVIFNLDSDVSTASLKQIFEPFGPVKELRETPLKRRQRFVEFYDVRDAAKALSEMNGREFHGKNLVIEFSRPGSHFKRLPKATQNATTNHNSTPSYSMTDSQIPSPPPLYDRFGGGAPPPPRCYSYQTKLKLTFGKVNPNGNAGSKSGGSNGGCGTEDSTNSTRALKKTIKKSRSTTSTATATASSKQQQQLNSKSGMNRPWKGKAKNLDPRFLINEDAIMESNCRDSRTTVMIKNIPNKYSQNLLLNMLDNHCIHCNEQIGDDKPLSSFDFVYLPIDFINKCNVGYGFVNMTSPEATLRLYKAFHLQNWEVFNSRKICEITYARLQGLEALKEHFKNSKFPCEADEYMPVVFSPPRDGRQLTEPLPIVGGRNTSPLPSYDGSAKCSEADCDCDDSTEQQEGNEEEEEEEDANDASDNEETAVGGRGRGESLSNGGDNGGHDEEDP